MAKVNLGEATLGIQLEILLPAIALPRTASKLSIANFLALKLSLS